MMLNQVNTAERPRRAIILSAGQGRRLLPFTESLPKCLLDVQGQTVIEWQIDALLAAGIRDIRVVVGYAAPQVEERLAARYGAGVIRPVFNPFYEVADNLASCWMVRQAMQDDFLLLNGDTLFDLPVLLRLLDAPDHPITLAIDRKSHYDSDDMKVCLEGDRLTRVGKTLALDTVNGESIGMMRFNAEGAVLFRTALEQCMYSQDSLKRWYLSVIDGIAQHSGKVFVQSVEGLGWGELDFPLDLESVRNKARSWGKAAEAIPLPLRQ